MRYVAKYWHLFIVSFVLIILNSYLAFVPQLVMRDIFNALMPPFDPTSVLGMLPVACLTIIGASVLSGVFVFCRDYAMRYVSQRALYDLRKSTFDALLSKSFSFYDQSQTGDIISRTTSDIEQVSRMLSMWIPRIAGTISTIIVFIFPHFGHQLAGIYFSSTISV